MSAHQHIQYSFSFRPRKEKVPYDLPICEDKEKICREEVNYVLSRVYSGNTLCTYVYEHKNPMPASSASVNCGIDWVRSYTELESFATMLTVLTQKDLDCVSGGEVVSLRSIQDIITSGVDASVMLRAVNDLVAAVQRNEAGKNDLLEQLLEKKFGNDFLVTRKPLNDRKGLSASPYAKSLPDIAVQHKEKCYKSGVLMVATVGSSWCVTGDEAMEGDSYAAAFEFKVR